MHWQNLRKDRHYSLWNDEFRFSQGPCGGSEIRLISDAKWSGIKKKKRRRRRTFFKTSQSSPPLRRISLERMLLHNCKGMQTGRDAHRKGGTKIPTDLLLFKGLNRAWMMDHFHSVRPRRFRKLSEGKVEYQYADSVRASEAQCNPGTTANALQSDTCFCRHLAP